MQAPSPSPSAAQTRADGSETTLRDAADAAAAPARHRAFGRYIIESELGRGGMGVVYRASDPQLDRPVALKVLLRSTREIDVARMTREAQAIAQLSHPNVVSIFDVGSSDGRVFIVMEYLEGVTLSAWILDRPAWGAVAKVFEKAGRGLAAAHERGLVHRDFKPANIALDRRGRVKVLDFGLARHEADGEQTTAAATGNGALPPELATLTATGFAMGTPPYMSPEQHRGERPTPATDIYAFGISLYEALYGELPFSGSDYAALLEQKSTGIPDAPLDPNVPRRIHAIVSRATAFDPEDRFSTMNELLAALRRARRRRKTAWGTIAAGCVGLAGAVSVALSPGPPASPVVSAATHSSLAVAAPDVVKLVAEAKRLREFDQDAEALGIAFAAWPAAITSGSSEAIGEARLSVGLALSRLQQKKQAEPHLREAVQLLIDAGAGPSALLGATERVRVLDYLERNAEALEQARAAEMLLIRFGLEGDPRSRVSLLAARAAPLSESDRSRAIELMEEALREQRAHPEEFTPTEVARTLENLALYIRQSQPRRALDLAEEGLDLLQSVHNDGTRGVLQARTILASVERTLGNHERALAIATENFLSAPEHLSQFRSREAAEASQYSLSLGRVEESLGWSDRAIELARSDPSTAALDIALLHAARANIYNELGQLAEAEEQLQTVLVIFESEDGIWSTNVLSILRNLAELIRAQDEPARAEPYAVRALELAERSGLGDDTINAARTTLAAVLLESGRPDEALEFLGAWIEAEVPGSRAGERTRARAKNFRARALWDAGESKAEAMRLARECADETSHDPRDIGLHREVNAWILEHEASAKPRDDRQ